MSRGSRQRVREAGWALMFVLFLSAALVISLAAVLPRAAFESQRDHEADLLFRGKDYTRGIQLYFRKFKKYPSRMEDLENTNQVRFLRNRWKDPVTGSDEWRLIHIGPAGVLVDSILTAPGGVPGATGPLGPGGALPPAGTIGGVNTPTPGPVGGSTFGSGSSFGSGGSSFGSGSSSFGSGSSFGGRPGGGTQGGIGGGPGGIAGQGGTSAGVGQGSTGFGSGSSGFGGGLGSASGIGTSVGGTSSGFAPAGTPTSLGGATFGAGIAGVASKSEKQSIRLYNGRQKYNEWEFVYDFRRDPVLNGPVGATGAVGTNLPASNLGGLSGGTGSSFGQTGGTGNTFGQPGGTGSTFGQPGGGFGQPPRPVGPPR